MGTYYAAFNYDKKEVLEPDPKGTRWGCKFGSLISGEHWFPIGLVYLMGTEWQGDRVVIAGDSSYGSEYMPAQDEWYDWIEEKGGWKNVSVYWYEEMQKTFAETDGHPCYQPDMSEEKR